jgi:hypothetical protein
MKWIIILFFSSFTTGFSQENRIKFTDNSEITIEADFYRNVSLIKLTKKLIRKELIATFTGVGKAPHLSAIGKLLNKKENNKSGKITAREANRFFNKLEKITTAYDFRQAGNKFYINGLNSINYEKLRDCSACEVKVRLIIMEIKVGDEIYYSPIIESIVRLKTVK